MNEIGSVTNRGVASPAHTMSASTEANERCPASGVAETAGDRVELSAAAQHGADPGPEAAQALEARIAEIRAQIAANTYLTPDKLDAVVERLHAELFGK